LLPFDIDRVHVYVSKHFRNTWIRKWDWDQTDLREALRVIAYDDEYDEVFIITGSEG